MGIYKNTTATKRIFSLTQRIRAVAGGTSASKTISILIWCIDYAQSTKNELVSVVSESYPHLEKGAMLDFENIMKDSGYWDEDRWHRTKHTYTFDTGSKIEFFSVDTYGKAHGPRRDVLFVNEANNMAHNIVDQLITRTRKIIWFDWNPTNEFWFYDQFEGKRKDLDFITLTYKDNEALDKVTVDEIESRKDNKQWWRVYGLGLLGEVEGKVFTGWKIIDEVPHEARLEGFGLDFGFSNDPASIVAVYYHNGGYIVDEITHQKGLSNKQLADILSNQASNALVIADSAEPKSIQEIKEHGINILGVAKLKGESKDKTFVKWSIDLVGEQQISMTKRSTNIIKCYRNYMWKMDKEGNFLNEPEHTWSDPMDAIRYKIISILKRPTYANAVQTKPVNNYYPDIGL